MSKAFVREQDHDEDDDALPVGQRIPAGGKNYMTPQGYARLRGELMHLIDEERPRVVETVSWAASNGYRSENGDYLYGKKRLREIDRRIRFLTKRLERAQHRIDLLRQEVNDYYKHFRVTPDLIELRNLVEVADLIVRSALSRHESRGLHYTLDYPATSDQATDTVLVP